MGGQSHFSSETREAWSRFPGRHEPRLRDLEDLIGVTADIIVCQQREWG